MNLSGIGINKVFKTNIPSTEPYYYVSGSLDLTGAVYGGTYFFNLDNNFTYSVDRDYHKFIMADENSVISEVSVYSILGIDATNPQSTYFAIGGADYMDTDNSVKVWWAAPPGYGPYHVSNPISTVERDGTNTAYIKTIGNHGLFSGQLVTITCSDSTFNETTVAVNIISDTVFSYTNIGIVVGEVSATGTVLKKSGAIYNGYPLDENDVNTGSVNYFGHDGGHFPYNLDPTTQPSAINSSKRYKYLAVTILDELPEFPQFNVVLDSVNEESKNEVIVIDSKNKNKSNPNPNERQKKGIFRGLPEGVKAVNSGVLNVTLKIYPKAR